MSEPDWDGVAEYLDKNFAAANSDCFYCDFAGNGTEPTDEDRIALLEDYWPLLEGSRFAEELSEWWQAKVRK